MLKKGDTIKCHDAEELLYLMKELEKEGYGTDFLYTKDGKEGLWLEITKGIRKSKIKKETNGG